MTCTKCGSAEWKTASVVYASDPGPFLSDLALKSAPPKKRTRPAKTTAIFNAAIFLVGLILFSDTSFSEHPVLTGYLFIVTPLIGSAAMLRLAFTPKITQKIEEQHKRAMESYAHRKVCMRCGHISGQSSEPEATNNDTPEPVTERG